MSSIEEQLRRDIELVTKDVVVTDSDLQDARASVDERIETDRWRGRNRTFLAAAAAAVVVAALGFTAFRAVTEDDGMVTPAGGGESPDVFADFLKGEAPTPESLNGFWRLDNGNVMVRFQQDGVVQFSDKGAIISDPVTTGTYEIDGDTITVITSDAPRCVSPEWTMRAAHPEPGITNLVLFDPQFGSQLGTCQKVASTAALHQVVPTGSILAGLDNSGVRGWQATTDKKWLFGDWMAEGGGYLLELTQDGYYYVVDDSAEVVDNGRWRFRDSALELFSRTESPQCDEGDWLVLGNLERVTPGTTMIRGTVEQNDCGGDWTPQRWIRIPDASTSDTSGS
jgi:hypothetical protein